MEVVGRPHGVNDDVGKRTTVETFHLDVFAKGIEVAIDGAEFAAAPVVVRVLLRRWRNRHFQLLLLIVVCWRSVRSGIRELRFHFLLKTLSLRS